MAKTLIDIDDELLAEATVALGTATKRETVNSALQFAVDETRARRTAAMERLERLAAEGAFDFERLAELDE